MGEWLVAFLVWNIFLPIVFYSICWNVLLFRQASFQLLQCYWHYKCLRMSPIAAQEWYAKHHNLKVIFSDCTSPFTPGLWWEKIQYCIAWCMNIIEFWLIYKFWSILALQTYMGWPSRTIFRSFCRGFHFFFSAFGQPTYPTSCQTLES